MPPPVFFDFKAIAMTNKLQTVAYVVRSIVLALVCANIVFLTYLANRNAQRVAEVTSRLGAVELRVWFNDLVMRELDEEIDRVATE